ncbi:MAG: FixH family protein [Helicobacteraceae bacterium]|nr:FixH family protein [Helicobacteraceae bacterium]
MNLSSGRAWPYAIGASILFIFGACVATIIVTSKMPVEASDTYMMNYHQADATANELIESQIAFDNKYKIEYINQGISSENTTLKYKLTDIKGNPVENARIKVVVTRPNNHKHDQEFSAPTEENGVYTFSSIKLPQEGRWDIMAKIDIDDLSRFYNFKADTRYKDIQEY